MAKAGLEPKVKNVKLEIRVISNGFVLTLDQAESFYSTGEELMKFLEYEIPRRLRKMAGVTVTNNKIQVG
jgi:hypothetical protein